MRIPAAAGLALLAACSTRPGYTNAFMSSDAPRVEDPAYRENLERFTRWHTHYDELDARIFLAATWEAWPLRRARAAAISEVMALSPARSAALLAKEMGEARRYTDVFVGLYTADLHWNDVSSPDSIWEVHLEGVPGGAVQPIAIERYERPDANLRALYPYLSPFWVGYRVRFPAIPGTRPETLVLRLASAVAQVEVRWDAADVEAPPPEEAAPPGEAPPPPEAAPQEEFPLPEKAPLPEAGPPP